MTRDLKDIFSGLFILLMSLSDAVYFMTMEAIGMGYDQTLFHIYNFSLAVFGVIYYIRKQHKVPINTKTSAFAMIFVVVVLYYMTQFLYEYSSGRYSSLFMALFPRFVVPILVGLSMIGDNRVLEKIEKALPYFVLIFTTILARYILKAKVDVNIGATFDNGGGLTYQSLSYYSVFMYGFAVCLISFSKMSRLWVAVLWGISSLCLVLCLMTGGRGAFVLAIVYTFYFLKKRFSLKSLLSIVVVIIILFLIFNQIQSHSLFGMGSERILGFFSSKDAIDNDERWERMTLAWNSFLSSPLWGHGLGSVYYEMGQYSHNIFTDMLCEGGLLLFILFVFNIIKFSSIYRRKVKDNYRLKIIFTIFLSGFIMHLFSGYYLTGQSIWLPMAYVLSLSYLRINKRNRYEKTFHKKY